MCAKNICGESSGSTAHQIVGRDCASAHSATTMVFPYPAGAATMVAPGMLVSNKLNRCFLERKLAGTTGATVRARFTPGITPCFMRTG